MNETTKKEDDQSSIVLKNRSHLSLSGVIDVESFNENIIQLNTESGPLKIHGNDFRINQLNLEVGNVSIDGQFNSLMYDDNATKDKRSFISRIFG